MIGGSAPNVGVLLACRAADGRRRRHDVAGDPRHDLRALCRRARPGLAGGLILGAAGFGNAVGPLLGGASDRRAQLALDLFPEPADRRVRHAASPGASSRADQQGIGHRSPHRLRGRRRALGRSLRASVRARPGIDLGWTDPLILGLFALAPP